MKRYHLCGCAVAVFLIAMISADASGEEVTNSLGMRLVLIPAGEFQMGAEEDPGETRQAFPYAREEWLEGETPRHRVRITRPFYMAARETRLREFLEFYHAASYKTDAERFSEPMHGLGPDGKRIHSEKFRAWNPGWEQTQEHPVNYVSWNDSVAFCRWLSQKEGRKYRLPSEAEWEYACRAGTTTRYWSGNDPEELTQIANVADQDTKSRWPKAMLQIIVNDEYRDTKVPYPFLSGRDGYVHTAPVGLFRPNPFGLYDMHGNLWEWCQDRYDANYYARSPVDDPQGPSEGATHVMRGGGWDDTPLYYRAAARIEHSPTFRCPRAGFRVVCEQE